MWLTFLAWLTLFGPIWSLIIVCVLLSLLVLIFLKQIRRSRLRIVLMATYFSISLLCLGVILGFRSGFDLSFQLEFLRQSSENTSRNVRILTLLEESDARQVNPSLYQIVSHNLEYEIDFLLPFANGYLAGKGSLERRLHDLLLEDLTETTFPRDLPAVVQYRRTHPRVWDHGTYDLVIKAYSAEAVAPAKQD